MLSEEDGIDRMLTFIPFAWNRAVCLREIPVPPVVGRRSQSSC
jgi:hypothetical protein